MFVHIGGQVSVALQDVVALLDPKLVKKSQLHEGFPSRTHEGRGPGMVCVNGDGLEYGQEPRCVVVTSSAVYLSPISLATLRRRLEVATGGVEGAGALSPAAPNARAAQATPGPGSRR
ncbi:MAG: DUF370 domain-containing protein [Firmicutes bacterium]|nr:DUF370 domain-containing protein [Bacillota bacterium]MDH7495870.1 DUF370 domain-containing protein [Bacillota bacterium]